MNISLLWAMWQHIMYLCVCRFQCREVCGPIYQSITHHFVSHQIPTVIWTSVLPAYKRIHWLQYTIGLTATVLQPHASFISAAFVQYLMCYAYVHVRTHYKLEMSYGICQQGGGHDFNWMRPLQRNSVYVVKGYLIYLSITMNYEHFHLTTIM